MPDAVKATYLRESVGMARETKPQALAAVRGCGTMEAMIASIVWHKIADAKHSSVARGSRSATFIGFCF